MLTDQAHAKNSVPRGTSAVFIPSTDAERELVREQLQHILASPAFQNSKRYASVLKYVVDQTLEGAGARLKERTIGIDVFDRTPDYDTASDHVVRSAIGEVRKRLAQYYRAETNGRLRIEVQPGCYTPQFRWPGEPQPRTQAGADASPGRAESASGDALSLDANPPVAKSPRNRRRAIRVAGGLLAVALCVAAAVGYSGSRDPLDLFWKPVLSSRAPILLCVGNLEGGRGAVGANPSLGPAASLLEFHRSEAETVHVYDAITLAKFVGLMEARGKQVRLASQTDATFSDLQDGPAILVGLVNNGWTKRLVSNLRFTVDQFTPAKPGKYVIRDRNNPSNQDWSVDFATPYLETTRDYAIVLRMVDPKTEKVVVVAAGITVFGTYAAGEFLTSREEMKKLAAAAPPGWEKKNMELVLSTDVILGKSGPAKVVAAQFW
jgi:hypothetical protein